MARVAALTFAPRRQRVDDFQLSRWAAQWSAVEPSASAARQCWANKERADCVKFWLR
jgi:hypothetical protein